MCVSQRLTLLEIEPTSPVYVPALAHPPLRFSCRYGYVQNVLCLGPLCAWFVQTSTANSRGGEREKEPGTQGTRHKAQQGLPRGTPRNRAPLPGLSLSLLFWRRTLFAVCSCSIFLGACHWLIFLHLHVSVHSRAHPFSSLCSAGRSRCLSSPRRQLWADHGFGLSLPKDEHLPAASV